MINLRTITVQYQHIGKFLYGLGIFESSGAAIRAVKQGGVKFNKESIPKATKYICFHKEKMYFMSEHPQMISDEIKNSSIQGI